MVATDQIYQSWYSLRKICYFGYSLKTVDCGSYLKVVLDPEETIAETRLSKAVGRSLRGFDDPVELAAAREQWLKAIKKNRAVNGQI